MSERDAAERLRDKLAQYYGPEVTRALFPPADDSEGEVSGSELMSDAVTPWISGERALSPPGEAERLVMTALLVLLHEGGGRHKVTFMLPKLLGLLDWPVVDRRGTQSSGRWTFTCSRYNANSASHRLRAVGVGRLASPPCGN